MSESGIKCHVNNSDITCDRPEFSGRVSDLKANFPQSSRDVSDVLAAALNTMDGIIARSIKDMTAEKDYSFIYPSLDNSVIVGRRRHGDDSKVKRQCLADLSECAQALERTGDPGSLQQGTHRDTRITIEKWLLPDVGDMFSLVRPFRTKHTEDIIRGLEVEKETLNLQVCVLTEQIEAQAEKIQDMEICIKEYKHKTSDVEDVVSQELLTRSSLEHHKLDLMAEVSHLKMRLASAEKDRRELDDRCRTVQRQVAELEAKLLVKDAENSELRLRLGRNGTLPVDSEDTEVEKLKRAVDTLMMTNEEKERKLEDLRRLLKRYRRVEEILVQAQGRKAVEELLMNLEDGDTSSNSSSTTPSVGEAVHKDQLQHTDDRLDGRPYLSSSSASSTPMHQLHNNLNGGKAVSSIPSDCRQAMGMTRSNSCEDVATGTKSKVPSFKKQDKCSAGRGVDGYGMLPKHCSKEDVREGKRFRGFHGLGKTLMLIRSGKRSSSAPNLGDQLLPGICHVPARPARCEK